MAKIATENVEIFGTGVLRAEGVVVDREGSVWGGGRNAKVYKVTPDGVVHEVRSVTRPRDSQWGDVGSRREFCLLRPQTQGGYALFTRRPSLNDRRPRRRYAAVDPQLL